MQTLEGSTSTVLRVKWLLYGLQLISASAEGVMTIWNVKKGVQICSYEQHSGRLWSIDIWDLDGEFKIITGDNESNLYLWQDDSENVYKE